MDKKAIQRIIKSFDDETLDDFLELAHEEKKLRQCDAHKYAEHLFDDEYVKNNQHRTKDFIAIDFETAKEQYPCQLGIAVVRNGEIVNKICELIKPKDNEYSVHTIAIHHITPHDTACAPEFPEVWEKIKNLFDDTFVVAHNAQFDISVLRFILHYYNLPLPEIKGYACTCDINNREGLEKACARYHIKVENHHDGLDDAINCAKLYLAYVNGEIPLHDNELPEEFREEHFEKSIHTDIYSDIYSEHMQLHGDILDKDLTGADPCNPFYDRKVVITGIFDIERDKLALKLKSMGADINGSISKLTNYVLVGEDPGPSKLKKIDELTAEGYDIWTLDQHDLDIIFAGKDYEKYHTEKYEKPAKTPKVKEVKEKKADNCRYELLLEKYKKKIAGEEIIFTDEELRSENYRLLHLYYLQNGKLASTKYSARDNIRDLGEKECDFRKDILSAFEVNVRMHKDNIILKLQEIYSKYGIEKEPRMRIFTEFNMIFKEVKAHGSEGRYITFTHIPEI